MSVKSAGVLLFRLTSAELEVLLVHPGGPFWSKKDLGAWSIPKGEIVEGEDPEAAAVREFEEETGFDISGTMILLTPIKQKNNKVVQAWAVSQDLNAENITSNFFEMEWPPKSGRFQKFPEVDKAAWFSCSDARQKILAAQIPLIDELEKLNAGNIPLA